MIELCGVTRDYGETRVLGPVDLHFEEGSTTVLIGPSGCGKSTMLRLIVGVLWPTHGLIRIGGIEVTEASILNLRRGIGYVIQEGGLFPHLTARRNVTLMARHLQWHPSRIDERVTELAEMVRLPPEQLDHYPGELSGGQRQRVSIMRALMLDPRILLLDEPLGSLDPMIRSELQQDLVDLFRTLGKTVVLVTHDLHEAARFAGRVVLLKDGRVEQQGSIRALRDDPASPFVTAFVRAQQHIEL